MIGTTLSLLVGMPDTAMAGVWLAMLLDWLFRAVLFRARWADEKWTEKRASGGTDGLPS